MNSVLGHLGSWLAHYLARRSPRHDALSITTGAQLRALLQPGDVLLVDGDTRISTAIKYLTQSSWSHAALYVGSAPFAGTDHADHCLVEADLNAGVRSLAIDEYTQVELRGLRSIPLALQPGDIAGLLERAARLHWSYDGRYYFIDNNCAVETWRLLRDGVPRLAALPLRSITPTGLLRKLERNGVADSAVLDDRDAALRSGYYFESAQARYQQMFALARQQLALPQVRHVVRRHILTLLCSW